MKIRRSALYLVLFLGASTCFAQMYRVTDLGTFGGTWSSAFGINASGQVVGVASFADDARGHPSYHAFRTSANMPINPANDDLGALGGTLSMATAINNSGQVVGWADGPSFSQHAFRTAPNNSINPATDDLGTFGGTISVANGINASGQVVGSATFVGDRVGHAFRTAPDSPVNPATDDLGTLGGSSSGATGINNSGQVVGESDDNDLIFHPFRTAPNTPINPATDDLGGATGIAWGINAFGQAAGYVYYSGWINIRAFRTAPDSLINPVTDDLGTLDPLHAQSSGLGSWAYGISDYGQVVGQSAVSVGPEHAFLYDAGMHDLNELIPASSGWAITSADAINNSGQIAATGSRGNESHALLLTPIYKAFVKQPINADGSSIFKAKRGVIPVKFKLTRSEVRTCKLPPATIALTKAVGGTLQSVDERKYTRNPDSGSDFRTDSCHYIYNLAASSLGTGTYRVDISISGVMVGHAVFALR